MSYAHIPNLYADQVILLFRECYALEKIHGTSTTIAWRNGRVWFSSGGASPTAFAALFDEAALATAFAALGYSEVVVHGEAYGGSQQKQAWRYGPRLRFVAFDVAVPGVPGGWLDVPSAAKLVGQLGLEFVHYDRIATDLAAVDAARDAPSEQARRNGVPGVWPREGVVLRPLAEFRTADGERVVAKHKRDEERETATPRRVVDPAQQVVLADAEAIALEWVTPTRLEHVLQKLPGAGIEQTAKVIAAMIEDVTREGKAEIVDSKTARAAIGRRAAALFKVRLKEALRG